MYRHIKQENEGQRLLPSERERSMNGPLVLSVAIFGLG
jgi:hypothetical protein